jgi:acyl-CoA thioester hydrolase
MLDVLTDYPIQFEQPVVWGELDPNGHVNNVYYFRYIENARVSMYQRIAKYDYESAHDVTILVASTSCRFRAALAFGDIVVTGVKVDSIDRDRFSTSYRIVRKADGATAAEAQATLVCVDKKRNEKVAIPAAIREKLEGLRLAASA